MTRAPLTLYVASYESRSFTFTGAGTTPAEARAVLLSALQVHTRQYDLEPGWYYPDDIVEHTLTAGAGYRDYERLVPRPKRT